LPAVTDEIRTTKQKINRMRNEAYTRNSIFFRKPIHTFDLQLGCELIEVKNASSKAVTRTVYSSTVIVANGTTARFEKVVDVL